MLHQKKDFFMTQISILKYRNNNLFSNYYLEKYLHTSPEWKKNEHLPVFEEIKKIYHRESAFFETLNEKQLEERFFKHVFTLLGFEYEVTEKTRSREFPDYALFSDRESRDDAHKDKNNRDFFTNAIAVGEVKQWTVELDRIGKDEYNRSLNPSLQLWMYLLDTEPKWGILSNGRIWRLYCKDRRRENYLEIDLPSLIESNDSETFKFFYYFFRKDAFIPSKDGSAFLDRVLKGSFDYAAEIGDSLKDNVYWAMKRIAEGFIERKSNHLDSKDLATLVRVQNNTMILLYRFLFLLYAEGKGLLDLNDLRYLNYYSFHRFKHAIAEVQDGPMDQRYDSFKILLLADLKGLFKLVDQGSESFGIPKEEYYIPAYNGGLFDPEKHPDLERWEIGDKYLADAIDFLSRSKLKDGHRDFVDYSTLEIRHLGSIYEGLLEYKLRVAESDLVVSDGEWRTLDEYNADRKQKKVFTDFGENDRVRAGHLYLATDKGERKSTGSYYTPDYIVNYIVKNTIGPVVEEKWKESQEKNVSYIDATLSINVLDPAMGSGHFLVGAVDFLSLKLLEAVQKDYEAGKIADTVPYTNDWARRDVVSHCIYGVDLNELAVELAKVGLWLTTISKDKPLSFLDHRLKQGNSLIGARLTNLRYYPGKEPKEMSQAELPTSISPRFIGHILSKIAELEAIEENRLEDIKRKEKAFEEFRHLPEYQRAKGLANVYTATYFGNTIVPTEKKSSEALYQDLVWAIAGDESEWQYKIRPSWFKHACDVAKEKSFFHWELEFPEIFFDAEKLRESPGWDVVIGNPPYVKANEGTLALLEDRKVLPHLSSYNWLYKKWDLFVAFIERGIFLLKNRGRISFIVSDGINREEYASKVRRGITNNLTIKRLDFFPKIELFPKVGITNTIFLLEKTIPSDGYIPERRLHLDKSLENFKTSKILHYPFDSDIIFNPDYDDISLNELTESLFFDEIFYISVGMVLNSDEKNPKANFNKNDLVSIIKDEIPRRNFVENEDLVRYHIQNCKYLEYGTERVPNQIRRPTFSELYSGERIYMSRNGEAYLFTDSTLTDQRVIIFKPWYQLANIRNRSIDSERNAVLKKYSCDIEQLNSESRKYNLKFFLTILNSGLLYSMIKARYKRDKYDITPDVFREVPIPKIPFNTNLEFRKKLLSDSIQLYNSYIENGNITPLCDFINENLSTKRKASDVVHDLLAFLAEQMVEMNKTKNIEIKTFLNFVENEIGISVDTLSNKTVIQEYYINEFVKFVEVLVKNKNKIKEGYNPKSPTNRKNLEAWYIDSCGKLKPLIAKIDATDALIDQIVYKLYGLTEEEIKIIEG